MSLLLLSLFLLLLLYIIIAFTIIIIGITAVIIMIPTIVTIVLFLVGVGWRWARQALYRLSLCGPHDHLQRPQGAQHCLYRGPKDRINVRISHPGSKAQAAGDRILVFMFMFVFMWSFGVL